MPVRTLFCSYCFLEMFQVVVPVPWPGLSFVLWGRVAGGGPACLVQVHAADVAQVGKVRGPPAAWPRLLPELCCRCEARGNAKVWLCLRASKV